MIGFKLFNKIKLSQLYQRAHDLKKNFINSSKLDPEIFNRDKKYYFKDYTNLIDEIGEIFRPQAQGLLMSNSLCFM